MKKLFWMLVIIAGILAFSFQANATALPWIDFGSTLLWDSNTNTLTNNGASTWVPSVTYKNGVTPPFSFPPVDDLLFSSVSLNLSFDGDNTNDFLTITDMEDPSVIWLDAALDITQPMPNIMAGSPNPYMVKIKSMGLSGSPGSGSAAIDQFFASLDMSLMYPAALNLSWSGSSTNMGGGIYQINANGKVAPVPEPATLLLLGSGLMGVSLYARKRRQK